MAFLRVQTEGIRRAGTSARVHSTVGATCICYSLNELSTGGSIYAHEAIISSANYVEAHKYFRM